jgi:NTP pyrophosphatase (non-canonical NTP hydrolase)
MNFDEYQAVSKRTFPPDLRDLDRLVFGLGLCGEAGEVAELLKKHHGHGKALDLARLGEELGDVLWYVAAIASAHGLDLRGIAAWNVEKLRARYPKGFTKGEKD